MKVEDVVHTKVDSSGLRIFQEGSCYVKGKSKVWDNHRKFDVRQLLIRWNQKDG